MLSRSSLRFLPPLVFLALAASCQDADRSVAPLRTPARFSVTDAPGSWTTKASMRTARWSLATEGVNGILYAVGGTSGLNPLATVEAFDPATNTWTTKASMPVGKTQSAAGVVNGILYVVGSSSTLAYDPATNTWTTKASIPAAQGSPAAGVVNGIVYVVGGFSGPNGLTTVQAYDPATDTWTSKASMPTARSHLAAGVVNGILYAVGGMSASGGLATVEAYDPATNTWTTKASMPTARFGLTAGVVNGILYAVGGSTGSDRLAAVEAYDPATNTWTSKASMPTARKDLGAGVVNGILYAVGGVDVTYSALARVEAYQPASGDEPVFNGAAGDSMIFMDTMDEYTTPQAMDTWPAPSFHPFFPEDTHYAVLSSGRDGSGKALRVAYVRGNDPAHFQDPTFVEERPLYETWPENNVWYSPPNAPFVVQYWFRISKNSGPGGSPGYGGTDKGMKWLELWRDGHADRSQIGVTAGDPTTGPLWHLNAAGDDPALGDTMGVQPVGPYWNQVNDYHWHRATYLYQPATSIGAQDGIARMWIDGTKIVDVSALAAGLTPPGGTRVWCTMSQVERVDTHPTQTIHLGEYMNGYLGDNSGTDLPMALDFDDFKWWRLPARVQ
jgi:N-acetylneuraminic acid mutarotase